MREKCVLLAIILALSVTAFRGGLYAQDEPIACAWASTVPKIDGLKQDWEGVPLIPQKHDVQLGFMNDSRYLYILFVFTNPKNLSSLDQTGITLFYNPEGKKKKDFGINFRKIQVTADQLIAIMEQRQGPMSDQDKARYKTNPSYTLFHYGIISKGKNEVLNADEREGVLPALFRIGRDQAGLAYEFAVPLKKAKELAPGIGTEAGKAVILGFEWGGWSRQLQHEAATRMAAMGAQARDQRASDNLTDGSDPGGVARMRETDAPEMAAMRKMQPKKYDFWVNVQLSNIQ